MLSVYNWAERREQQDCVCICYACMCACACSRRQKVSFGLVQRHVDLATAYLLMLSVSRNLSKHWGLITGRSSLSRFALPRKLPVPPITQILKENKLSSPLRPLSHLPPVQNLYSKSLTTRRPLSICFCLRARECKTWVPFSCCKTARSLSLSSVLFSLLKISTDTAVLTGQTAMSCQR